MDNYRRALERIRDFPNGLETPVPRWEVILQMAQIAKDALRKGHKEFPPLRRECDAEHSRR